MEDAQIVDVTPKDAKPARKVLIAVPTVGLEPDPNRWLTAFIQTLDEFKAENCLVSVFFPYKVAINQVDELIFMTAIVNQFDYLFRMDDDIWNVPKGSVKKLLDADKDFISGIMPINDFPYSLCAFIKKDKSRSLIDTFKDKTFDFNEVMYSKESVIPVDLTAMPYTLLKVSAMLKLEPPFFGGEPGVPNDSIFCQKCLDAGIQPFVHMGVQVCHRNVTPFNRWYLFNADARQKLASGQIPKDHRLYEKLVAVFGEDGSKDIGKLLGTDPGQTFSVVNRRTGEVPSSEDSIASSTESK